MERQRLVKVVEEVRRQCRFGKIAWQGLRSSLNGMDSEKAFFYVHALLDRARLTTRFLWPTSEEGAERAGAVREVLKVDEDSALKASELAVFAEAADVQFDRWLDGLGHFRYIGMNIMPQGTMAEFQRDTFLRSLDPEVFQFAWYDRTIDLRKIARSLHELESMADAWLKRQ
ncbi:MAG: hypothetical protein M2R45_03311 [Verrucomicrobia subdivision 3 bacterium]|nr:hypothetical protein [Limisphaerales bacterium]MCS1415411.1 hypothetical protein [Limisphaerales bacterium]